MRQCLLGGGYPSGLDIGKRIIGSGGIGVPCRGGEVARYRSGAVEWLGRIFLCFDGFFVILSLKNHFVKNRN